MEGTSRAETHGYDGEFIWYGRESIEYSSYLELVNGLAATLSVEIFLGDELVKSCMMSKADSSWDRCCNAQFCAHGQDVRFKYTCHYSGDEYQTCQVSLYAEVNRLTTTMTMTRTVTNTTMPEEVGMATQWHIPVTAFAGFMSCLFA